MMEVFISKMPNTEERFEAYRRIRLESAVVKNRYSDSVNSYACYLV